ncbi:hypothetical protein GGG16DRAFT_118665 [Schizophyllum commune]
MSRRRKRSPRASPRRRALRTLIGTGAWMGPGGPSKSLRVHTGAFRPIRGALGLHSLPISVIRASDSSGHPLYESLREFRVFQNQLSQAMYVVYLRAVQSGGATLLSPFVASQDMLGKPDGDLNLGGCRYGCPSQITSGQYAGSSYIILLPSRVGGSHMNCVSLQDLQTNHGGCHAAILPITRLARMLASPEIPFCPLMSAGVI